MKTLWKICPKYCLMISFWEINSYFISLTYFGHYDNKDTSGNYIINQTSIRHYGNFVLLNKFPITFVFNLISRKKIIKTITQG